MQKTVIWNFRFFHRLLLFGNFLFEKNFLSRIWFIFYRKVNNIPKYIANKYYAPMCSRKARARDWSWQKIKIFAQDFIKRFGCLEAKVPQTQILAILLVLYMGYFNHLTAFVKTLFENCARDPTNTPKNSTFQIWRGCISRSENFREVALW